MPLAVLKRMQPADANAAIDDVSFREPVRVGELLRIDAEVVETGDSSVVVAVRVEAEDVLAGETRHTHDARFTMVAVGEDGSPISADG